MTNNEWVNWKVIYFNNFSGSIISIFLSKDKQFWTLLQEFGRIEDILKKLVSRTKLLIKKSIADKKKMIHMTNVHWLIM